MYKLQVKLNSVFKRLTNGHLTTWRDFSKNMEVEKWYLIALWSARFQISVKIFLAFLRDLKKKKNSKAVLHSPVQKIILRTSSQTGKLLANAENRENMDIFQKYFYCSEH